MKPIKHDHCHFYLFMRECNNKDTFYLAKVVSCRISTHTPTPDPSPCLTVRQVMKRQGEGRKAEN